MKTIVVEISDVMGAYTIKLVILGKDKSADGETLDLKWLPRTDFPAFFWLPCFGRNLEEATQITHISKAFAYVHCASCRAWPSQSFVTACHLC